MILTEGTPQELDALSNQLFEFNKTIVPDFKGKDTPFEFVRYVFKQEDQVIAGISGKICINNVLFIDDFFVIEIFRKQGLASKLLERLESEAKVRGCYLAVLETINEDAVVFYQKRGYEVFAILDNVPCPNVQHVHMKKDFISNVAISLTEKALLNLS